MFQVAKSKKKPKVWNKDKKRQYKKDAKEEKPKEEQKPKKKKPKKKEEVKGPKPTADTTPFVDFLGLEEEKTQPAPVVKKVEEKKEATKPKDEKKSESKPKKEKTEKKKPAKKIQKQQVIRFYDLLIFKS